MKKTWLKIKEFKFTDLKKRGLKELNKGIFRTSPWINNIVRRKNFALKKKFPNYLQKCIHIHVKHNFANSRGLHLGLARQKPSNARGLHQDCQDCTGSARTD